ncbi:MAG: hypothetical protein LBJ59_05955 [Zoogloeaceae bacterium]|jgi:hypothetical protein|nr:hypothetical protein [Zoogloeaceae bacterium]
MLPAEIRPLLSHCYGDVRKKGLDACRLQAKALRVPATRPVSWRARVGIPCRQGFFKPSGKWLLLCGGGFWVVGFHAAFCALCAQARFLEHMQARLASLLIFLKRGKSARF